MGIRKRSCGFFEKLQREVIIEQRIQLCFHLEQTLFSLLRDEWEVSKDLIMQFYFKVKEEFVYVSQPVA